MKTLLSRFSTEHISKVMALPESTRAKFIDLLEVFESHRANVKGMSL